MNKPLKIVIVLGTRPEAIKLASVIDALNKNKKFTCKVISTGQQREMLQQTLVDLKIKVDIDLKLMRKNQSLSDLTSRIFTKLNMILKGEHYDWLVVQGDTTTAFCAAICGFYHNIKIAHVEAGLRTNSISSPFPEEMNRRLISSVANLHLAPTKQAIKNLISEKIPLSDIIETGNTGIDLLINSVQILKNKNPKMPFLISKFIKIYNKYILITSHRRENFGDGIEKICIAIKTLAENNPEIGFIFSVHLNPNINITVKKILSGKKNILLIEPQPYFIFNWLMYKSIFILSDSGGIQEEAPALGKLVLVMRDSTERPEGIFSGAANLVGSDSEKIIDSVNTLLINSSYKRKRSYIYGDGKAYKRIIQSLQQYSLNDN